MNVGVAVGLADVVGRRREAVSLIVSQWCAVVEGAVGLVVVRDVGVPVGKWLTLSVFAGVVCAQ